MRKLVHIAFYIFLTNLVAFSTSQAHSFTCPPADLVKSVKFKEAYRDKYDATCWNFFSFPIMHENKAWNIIFGTFLTGLNPMNTDLLIQGQNFFQKVKLIIPNPKPVAIPDHLLCDYVPPGRIYWISAITPPEMS